MQPAWSLESGLWNLDAMVHSWYESRNTSQSIACHSVGDIRTQILQTRKFKRTRILPEAGSGEALGELMPSFMVLWDWEIRFGEFKREACISTIPNFLLQHRSGIFDSTSERGGSTSSAMSELAKQSWQLPESFLPYNRTHLFICFAGILTNAVLQVQFWKNRSHIKTSSVPLLHVSICDTLLLTATAVSCIALDITRELSWTWCQVNGFSIIFFIAPSALSFTVISVDRYKQIISGHPTTRREMSFMLFMTWITSAVLAMLPLATETFFVPQAVKIYCLGKMFGSTTGHRIYGIVTSAIIVIACSIVGGCYYSIYKKAIADGFKWRNQSFVSTELLRETTEAYESADKSAKKSNVHGASTGSGANSTNSVSGSKPKSTATHNDAYQKQLQLTIKLALLTLYFYTTWSPTLASYLYQMISNQPVSREFDFFSSLLTNGASVVNPILVLSMDSRWRVKMPKLPWRRREVDV